MKTIPAPNQNLDLQDLVRQCRNRLGCSRTGRMTLHVLCMIQRPSNASWHLRGLWRELAR